VDVGNLHANSKYTVLQISQDINRKQKSYLDAQTSKNMRQLCASWGLEDYYTTSFQHKTPLKEDEIKDISPPSKRHKQEGEDDKNEEHEG